MKTSRFDEITCPTKGGQGSNPWGPGNNFFYLYIWWNGKIGIFCLNSFSINVLIEMGTDNFANVSQTNKDQINFKIFQK